MRETKRIQISYDRPDASIIREAVAILKGGGVIVAPTETQYGLLCNTLSQAAIERIFELKSRPRSMPMAVFARSIDQLAEFGRMNSTATALAGAFLPGPITLVIDARPGYPEPPAENGRIGLRVSPAPIIEQICSALDLPLSATSANRSNEPTPATATEIEALFGESVDLYLDAGPCDRVASTVIDTTAVPPRILREGAIARSEIEKITRELKAT